ncbi:hypothetical protein DFJ74DRAFT_768146 [Hyaloraphidium curvatum]|nr:hypothetical protein DFJ74DRAFT_768146 [Hyaloraphidium curvatum]
MFYKVVWGGLRSTLNGRPTSGWPQAGLTDGGPSYFGKCWMRSATCMGRLLTEPRGRGVTARPASMSIRPAMPGALTDEELSAALPFVGRPPPRRPFDDGDADGARRALHAALSAAEPPTEASLLRAAERSSRLLGIVARCFLPFARPGPVRWLLPAGIALNAATVALVASYPGLAGTTAPFGAKNIAAGSAAFALFALAVSWPMVGVFRIWNGPTGYPVYVRAHQLTVLWRWRLLVDHSGAAGARGDGKAFPAEESASHVGPLVAHEGDPSCACPLPSCAGNLAHQTGLWVLSDFAIRMALLVFGVSFTPLWTPMVSSAVLWRTWWGTLIGAAVLATILAFNFFLVASNMRIVRAPMTQLSSRLICRCLATEIGHLLNGYRQPATGHPDEDRDWAPVYAILDHLTHAWEAWQDLRILRSFTVASLALLPAAVLNLAAGACVPLWELGAGAWWLAYILDNLAIYAASNARIGAAAAVLCQAASAARGIAAKLAGSAARSSLPDPAAAAELRDHAAQLEACAAAWAPARFLGFEVTYGTLRALVATLLTVGFALWGILRGLGVAVVLESYCYG